MGRIALVAPPFAGHLHPILALARGLQAEHEVVVVSSPSAARHIESAGLQARVVVANADGAIAAIADTANPVRRNWWRLYRQFRANQVLMVDFRREFDEFCREWRPELVIADFIVPVAGFVAGDLEIPWWTTLPSPCVIETLDGPPTYVGWGAMDNNLGRLRDALGRAAVRAFKTTFYLTHERSMREFGLPSMYRPDGSERIYSTECVLALGVREIEFAKRWQPAVRFVGPALYTAVPACPFKPEFGPGPNVLVTIGTHVPFFKERMAAATRRAARALPHVTFHYSAGDVGGTLVERDGNFTRVPYVRYDSEVPKYDLVVHHAGTGILNECLRAGIPSLVYPIDYDQPEYAARLVRAGLSRRVRRLDALADDVARALDDGELRRRAREFVATMQRYDAPRTVAELVRERLGTASAVV